MTPLRLVVLGSRSSDPYAGMAWMHQQVAAGPLKYFRAETVLARLLDNLGL